MAAAATPSFPPGYAEEYIGGQLMAFSIVMIVVQVFTVGLRFVARTYSKLPFGTEDVLVIGAFLASLGCDITSLLTLQYGGAGHHIAVVAADPQKVMVFAQITIPFNIFYQIGITLPRLAMLMIFLRIFIRPWERNVSYVVMFVLSGQCIANIITDFLQCHPLAYYWNPAIPGGWCIDQNAYWRWCTFPGIVCDLIMMLLPIPTVFRVQLAWKDKIGVLLTFIFGGIGLVTSIVRFVMYMIVNNIGPTADGTWASISEGIVALAETTVYLIAACLPSYRSLYLSVRRTQRSRKTNTSDYGWGSRNKWKNQQIADDKESTVELRPISDTASFSKSYGQANGHGYASAGAEYAANGNRKDETRIVVTKEYSLTNHAV